MTVDRSAPPLPVATVLGITAAAALVPLNSTMIVVALPSIADSFGMTTAQASVLITVYLVCMLVGTNGDRTVDSHRLCFSRSISACTSCSVGGLSQ